jgi:nitric oxide reductase large subunit
MTLMTMMTMAVQSVTANAANMGASLRFRYLVMSSAMYIFIFTAKTPRAPS